MMMNRTRWFAGLAVVAALAVSGCEISIAKTSESMRVPPAPFNVPLQLDQPLFVQTYAPINGSGNLFRGRVTYLEPGCTSVNTRLDFSDGTIHFLPVMYESNNYQTLLLIEQEVDPTVTVQAKFSCNAPFGSGIYDADVDIIWTQATRSPGG